MTQTAQNTAVITFDGGSLKIEQVAALSRRAALGRLSHDSSFLSRIGAGSAQVDYHFVPTAHDAKAFPNGFDGFTTELAGKLAVDFSERVSANLKVCYGCHGFEADMMYFDFRVADELNFRAGRFRPSFGAFNLRHDPANHRSSDKPLPYDMGRMLRMRQWNLGVLPSPFPDNGLEIDGNSVKVLHVFTFNRDALPPQLEARTTDFNAALGGAVVRLVG